MQEAMGEGGILSMYLTILKINFHSIASSVVSHVIWIQLNERTAFKVQCSRLCAKKQKQINSKQSRVFTACLIH